MFKLYKGFFKISTPVVWNGCVENIQTEAIPDTHCSFLNPLSINEAPVNIGVFLMLFDLSYQKRPMNGTQNQNIKILFIFVHILVVGHLSD